MSKYRYFFSYKANWIKYFSEVVYLLGPALVGMWLPPILGGIFLLKKIQPSKLTWVYFCWQLLLLVLLSGEEKVSFGYDSSGKKALDSEFTEYGQTFGADDVIGCYLVSDVQQ